MKSYFICSDVHDDFEAFRTFTDYAQAQEGDGLWVLGDLGLRPYSKQSLKDLLMINDVKTFLQEKTEHSQGKLREFKRMLKRFRSSFYYTSREL